MSGASILCRFDRRTRRRPALAAFALQRGIEAVALGRMNATWKTLSFDKDNIIFYEDENFWANKIISEKTRFGVRNQMA
jgi:hypothetical protein